ncbi:hypothetical protein FTO60_06165 [Octadecabacter sp. SW4]|uniref:hypothetical protein n=1 Tax=Octadecabacter sp. SW4 TaxID=2602067 RepID=UPI0011C1E72A|nr:hypothetical protein [Octadecabacter sp. SW4]QEE35325.1 hypothetical protein FTO60_06165 [Octadecabacter sp. SW4]
MPGSLWCETRPTGAQRAGDVTGCALYVLTLTDRVAAVVLGSGGLGGWTRILACALLIADAIERLHKALDGSQ